MSPVETVVKIGGGLLQHAGLFAGALTAISAVGRERRLLVVTGGGPFADAVRETDRRLHLSDDTAHWMAVLAMDQYAHLVAERLAGGVLVSEPGEIAAAFHKGIPVLAPYRWLHDADPLPHSWDVTSDSIAAWVAGQVGARRLVLIKPPGSLGQEVVDPYFQRALPAGVTSTIVPGDQIQAFAESCRQ